MREVRVWIADLEDIRTDHPELSMIAMNQRVVSWLDHEQVVKELGEAMELLKKERDEADRRAGAAERELQRYKDAQQANDQWLDKAKEQWGVHRHTSFDLVWEEALALKRGTSHPH